MNNAPIKPQEKPKNPCFSSGPCAKRPGWSLEVLKNAYLGRSHRASGPKKRLKDVIEKHRSILGIPADYKIGIVPASDTGAVEMAMWSLLGPRGVDVFVWESFSAEWLNDIANQLKLTDLRRFEANYGDLPDLSQADPARDCVFVWNGTTSGACVPNGDWISKDRQGLTICDATSAVFAYDMPWQKLDVTTWSWQKVLGGEAAHGMIVLSPRAVERLETHVPSWPIPKIFLMTKKGKLIADIFEGATINTPSMIAVEDCYDALTWVESIGGLKETISRSQKNMEVLKKWISTSKWAGFLASDASSRSATSCCLKITDPWFQSCKDPAGFIKAMTGLLEKENAAYDIASYRDAPPGLRIWCGATVESHDIQTLLPWLDWAYEVTKSQSIQQAA